MDTPAGVVAVAYSGGRDSTALLHATLRSAAAGTAVVALHVHHGLQPQADDWLAHCEATCRRWADAGARLTFSAIRLEGRPPRGASTEAWAR
ncbi:MAG TPA: ATP-binding protein, partial [Ideonella sp.]|nr:ATP-binding protein [Ideonella sp.]